MSLIKMVALLVVLPLVTLALQPAVGTAQEMCMGPGHYHVDCLKATVTPAQAEAAIKQCIGVVSKPECAGAIKKSGSNMYGCATYIIRSFATEACDEVYDSGEETNPGCALRANFGLGKPENRATLNRPEHFTCA
ncbi:hypothetical protein V8C86DRAFT_2441804 [Haematococcus lacustris]